LAAAKQITFTETVDALYVAKRSGWRSAKHAHEWRQTLRVYAEPKLGNLAVGAIDTGLVLQVLEPLWRTRTVSAGRLRQRLESVFDYAKARQWREGTDLRRVEGVIADCLEFMVLTAVRTSEAREATWDEVVGNTWIVPPQRTKRFRELRVSLSPAALAVLDRRRKQSSRGFIFPGRDDAIGDRSSASLWKSCGRATRYTVCAHRSAIGPAKRHRFRHSGLKPRSGIRSVPKPKRLIAVATSCNSASR
jgi:integrase